MPSFDYLPCPALVTNRAGLVLTLNQRLLQVLGGNKDDWLAQPMDRMFAKPSQIFLQTHVWPMVLRENHVDELRLQLLDAEKKYVPVFVNCQQMLLDRVEQFTWVFFVTLERSRYEQALLESRQKAEQMAVDLAKSEQFLRTVADAIPSMIAYWDKDVRCQFANKPYISWFGKTPQEMLGMPMPIALGKKLFEENFSYIQGALAGEAQEFERDIRRPDGSTGHALANYLPDRDAQGNVNGFFALVTNISRLREADAAIRLSASVFEATMEGIMVTDAATTIVSVNPAFFKLTGYGVEEVIGCKANILNSGRHEKAFFTDMFRELGASKFWKGEVWSRRKDGSNFLEQLSISAICDLNGQVSRYVGVFSDITEKWDKEQIIRHMALNDSLTGLPNRSLLMERIGQLLVMSDRESRHIALMFLDLDGFKQVNDTWGHEIGDQVLKTVSARLLALLRTSDTVARLGGDEFVVLLNNFESRDSVARIAERIIEELNEPMMFDGKTAHVGASVGIALYQAEGVSAARLLKNADDAMYRAKAAGKNTWRFADA